MLDPDPPKPDCSQRAKRIGIIKKPPVALGKLRAMEGVGGAGENRTPVQTSNYKAFYMFSFRLIFDECLTGNGPTNAYLLKVLVLLSKRQQPYIDIYGAPN